MTYNTACNDINQYFKFLTGNRQQDGIVKL